MNCFKLRFKLLFSTLTVIITVILLSGCYDNSPSSSFGNEKNNNQIVEENNKKNNNQIVEEILKDKIGSNNIINFEITDLKNEDEGVFAKFVFTSKEPIEYEGLAYLSENKNKLNLENINYTKIDTKVPITHTSMGGSLKNNVGNTYFLVSGCINDIKVKTVKISFSDKTDTYIKLGNNQKTYFILKVSYDKGIDSISALDSNDKVLYTY